MVFSRKRAFSLIEMIIVITILGIMFSTVKNFLNTTKQDRKLFGETCVNYVFGTLSTFQSDAIYGRSSGLILSGNLSPDYFLITSTGYLNAARTIGWAELNIAGRKGVTGRSYWQIPLVSGLVPVQCNHRKFVIVSRSTIATGTQVYMPAVVNKDANRYIGRDWTQPAIYPAVASGAITLSACDKGTITAGAIPSVGVKNCIDVAKIVFDKRSQQFYLWKCTRIQDNTGLCGSRPSF